jgi:hypothetical protein
MEFEDEYEMIAAEQGAAMARELKRLADSAPDGQVLGVVEPCAVEQGRQFMCDRLRDALTSQAADLEKKEGADGSASAAGLARATAAPAVSSSLRPAR